jgi:hypothetical protein
MTARITRAAQVVAGVGDTEGRAVRERDLDRIAPSVAGISRTEIVIERGRRAGCDGSPGRGTGLTGDHGAAGAGQRGGHCADLGERERDVKERSQL